MRRTLLILAIAAGVTWAGMLLWAGHQPETERRAWIRTGAFVVMICTGLLRPLPPRRPGERYKERF
jgi:hypothetical protein